MSSPRALEVFLGVVMLISVISVPVPKRDSGSPLPQRAQLDLRKLEDLHRESQLQHSEISLLTRETRNLADILRDGGTVSGNPLLPTPRQENEPHECSH